MKLELGPINVFITPAIFHFYGREFLAAEERYSPPGKYSPVPYYLVCHSIELFLKGHLSLRGLRSDELKAIFGHNLEKCLDEAEACDLSEFAVVHGVDRVEIAKANEYYLKKGFEYSPGVEKIFTAYPGLPDLDALRAFATRLRDGLRVPCMTAKMPPPEEVDPLDNGGDA